VDAVAQVTRVTENLVAAPPEEVRSAGAEAVTGVARVGQRLLILLDLERILAATTAASSSTDSSTPPRP
jgi:purine-binding chemotaxis protein CheW